MTDRFLRHLFFKIAGDLPLQDQSPLIAYTSNGASTQVGMSGQGSCRGRVHTDGRLQRRWSNLWVGLRNRLWLNGWNIDNHWERF